MGSHAEEQEARRRFGCPPASGEWDDLDLSFLDPGDPDGRMMLIRAEHPEMAKAIDDDAEHFIVAGEPTSPRLHLALHEVVANQLWDGEPPETWETAKRLTEAGYDRHDVLHMLAFVVGEQVRTVLAEQRPADNEAMIRDFDRLPGSWEALRLRPGGGPARLRARRGRRRR